MVYNLMAVILGPIQQNSSVYQYPLL